MAGSLVQRYLQSKAVEFLIARKLDRGVGMIQHSILLSSPYIFLE